MQISVWRVLPGCCSADGGQIVDCLLWDCFVFLVFFLKIFCLFIITFLLLGYHWIAKIVGVLSIACVVFAKPIFQICLNKPVPYLYLLSLKM